MQVSKLLPTVELLNAYLEVKNVSVPKDKKSNFYNIIPAYTPYLIAAVLIYYT